eukprot:1546432-Rhodomonas_salina.1
MAWQAPNSTSFSPPSPFAGDRGRQSQPPSRRLANENVGITWRAYAPTMRPQAKQPAMEADSPEKDPCGPSQRQASSRFLPTIAFPPQGFGIALGVVVAYTLCQLRDSELKSKCAVRARELQRPRCVGLARTHQPRGLRVVR